MIRKILIILLMNVMMASAIYAEKIIVDIEKSVKLALENNLELKSSRLDVAISKRAADLSWNRFIPSISASSTMMRFNIDPMVIPNWGLSAELDISLILSLSLIKEIEGTKIDYAAGLITYKTALKQMERDVKKNFYNILVFEENLWLMEENIEAAQSRFKQAKINYNNGLVPKLSVLSAQVGYENLKPTLTEMKLTYTTMINSFKILLGIDLEEEIMLEGDIVIDPVQLDSEKLINYFLGGRYDIQFMNKSIESLENTKAGLKLQTLTPMLSFGLNYDPGYELDPLKTEWFKNIDDNWNQKNGMFRMTLAMSLDSLFPWSKTQIGIRDMEDSIAKMKLGIAQINTGARMEIATLVMNLNKSMEQLETLDLNISLANEAYLMSLDAYDAGSRELLEVKDSEQDLNTAKLEVLKEKYNYITGLFDLEYALNASMKEIKEVANE